MVGLVVRAEVGAGPLWSTAGEQLPVASLPLSERLVDAINDWAAFWDDVGGEVSDSDIMEEFVGQGFKIAHALRRELKGSSVHLQDPRDNALHKIELRRPR